MGRLHLGSVQSSFVRPTDRGSVNLIQLKIRESGLDVHRSDGTEYTIIGVVGDRNRLDVGSVQMMPGVREILMVTTPYKLSSREFHPEDSIVRVGEACLVGGMEVAVMAGPCAVESEEQLRPAPNLWRLRCADSQRGRL
jgi:3-deoxy-7-phosphoheptulonate synthase